MSMDKEQSAESKRLHLMLKRTSWLLRFTEHSGKPSPVLIVKERVPVYDDDDAIPKTFRSEERGLLYGAALRRCVPVLRYILNRVSDADGIPLGLEGLFPNGRIRFRGNVPLDEQSGAKLALLFKLRERVNDLDRVELMGWRIERFGREEANYWFSRTTQFGETGNRWALAGMRIMLGGQNDQNAITQMLEKVRR